MQFVSLLGGLGQMLPIHTALDVKDLIPVANASTQPKHGQCSADGRFIWIPATATFPGYWERIPEGQTCETYTPSGTTPPKVHDHRGSDTKLKAPPPKTDITVFDANVQSGVGRFVVVDPFKFPADVERSAFQIWGGPKLPPRWQELLIKAMQYPGTKYPIEPGLAYYFDNPPPTYRGKFFGLLPDGRPVKQPKWWPIAKVKHPISGKDYGVFVGYTSRYRDRPMNDPEQGPFILTFQWAPIDKAWYEDVWDWIVEMVGEVVEYVCEKISDPTTAAAVAAAATAGGPVTVGTAAGAALLCQRPTPQQQQQQEQTVKNLPPAVTPKVVWPYYLAGGLVFAGLVAFLLMSPKKKPA